MNVVRLFYSALGYFMPCCDDSPLGELWGIKTANGYIPLYGYYSRETAEKRAEQIFN